MFDVSKDSEAQRYIQNLAVKRVITKVFIKYAYTPRHFRQNQKQYGHSLEVSPQLVYRKRKAEEQLEHEILKRKKIESTAASLRYEAEGLQRTIQSDGVS